MEDNMKKYVLLIYILVLVTFVSYATYSDGGNDGRKRKRHR